jgi:hypothetical protein
MKELLKEIKALQVRLKEGESLVIYRDKFTADLGGVHIGASIDIDELED